MLESIIFLILFFGVGCYNNQGYIKIQTVLIYMLITIVYNYNCNFLNLSIYYQTINYLNSKNNISIINMMFVLLLLNKKKLTNNRYIYLVIFIIISYSVVELNQTILLFFGNKSNTNTNLTNGIMLIHPYILYFFYALFINFFLIVFSNLFLTKYRVINTQVHNKNSLINIFIIIYLSIILGCFWAEQELSWGGWWSWDFVELLALNYLVFKLYNIHNNSVLLNRFNLFLVGIILFFLALLSVRFNIINSIHNFINVESQNQYYYYVILLLFLFFLYILYFSWLTFLKNIINIPLLFLVLIFIPYYLLVHNILIINIIKSTQNIQLNIKYVYLILFLFFLFIFFLLKFKYISYSIVFIIICLDTSYINVSLFIVFSYLFFINFNKGCLKLRLIHAFLFLLIVLTQKQLYIFYPEVKQSFISTIQNLKINNHIFMFKSCLSDKLSINNINITTYMSYDIYNCFFDFSFGLDKNMFDKSIIYDKNNLIEVYNYNFQKLTQILGFSIFFLLILIVPLLVFLLNKTKNIFY